MTEGVNEYGIIGKQITLSKSNMTKELKQKDVYKRQTKYHPFIIIRIKKITLLEIEFKNRIKIIDIATP